ncbi:uncharacterized protein [Argopecten irradians]|uniref:uncharacterized protein n=1 Tax=Argopecten irradians TaxID=31199 RepID=UPI00372438DE
MSWSSSIQYCRENNGSLIVLDSLDKWHRFTSENDLNHGGEIGVYHSWIAMNTASHHCENYTWLGGIPYTWAEWEAGQPANCGSRQCVKLRDLKMRTAECLNSWLALCENDTTDIPSSTESVTPTNAPTTADRQSTIRTHRMLDSFSYATTSPVDGNTDTTVSNEEVTSNDKDFTTNNHITTTDLSSTESASSSGPSSTDSGTTSTPYDLTHKYYTTSTNFSLDTKPRTTEGNDATTSISNYITYNNTQTDTMQCCCRKAKDIQFTPEELQTAIAAMKKTLTVLKSNTSMSRRKLISVYDARPSSVMIGSSGCVIIIFILCLIVVPDILHLVCAVTNTTEIPSSTESVTPTNEPSTADKQTTITTHRMSDLFSDATTSPVDDDTDTTVSNEEVTSNDKDFTTNNHITTTGFFSTESASLTGPSSTDSGTTSTPYDLTHKYDTTSTNFSVDDNLRTTEVNDATTSISSDYITYNNTQTDTMQCCCRKAKEIQFKPEELQTAIAAMKKKLTVLKSNTSMSRRKLISVYDARPSSVIIGSSGCVIIIFILCLIVIPDILHLVYAVTNKKGQRSNNHIQV